MDKTEIVFGIGDSVIKDSGDYTFIGDIVSIFKKKSGKIRVVVENKDGMLFIFNIQQLRHIK